jgi:hypothetical protein
LYAQRYIKGASASELLRRRRRSPRPRRALERLHRAARPARDRPRSRRPRPRHALRIAGSVPELPPPQLRGDLGQHVNCRDLEPPLALRDLELPPTLRPLSASMARARGRNYRRGRAGIRSRC